MLMEYFQVLITFPQSLGSMFEFIFFDIVTKSSLNPGRGQRIGLGPYKFRSK